MFVSFLFYFLSFSPTLPGREKKNLYLVGLKEQNQSLRMWWEGWQLPRGSGLSSPGAARGALGSSGWGSATENTATHAFGLHRLPLRVFPPSRLHVQGLAARSRPLTSAPCLPLRPATFTYIKEIRALKKYANPARREAGAFLERSPFIEAFN